MNKTKKRVVAFSGGKDSTALVLRMNELGYDFKLLFTPTGNELPDLHEHISRIQNMVNKELIIPKNNPLLQWIVEFNALPNHRQRWCTRLIKIEPCIAWLKKNSGFTLCVGLRADEPERKGIYSELVESEFPMHEWGWSILNVNQYNESMGVIVPKRTDCAWCPFQRIQDWYLLWRDYRDLYNQGMALENITGHTFRSPSRDTWPASMKNMSYEFMKGRKIRGFDEDEDSEKACRVCSL